MKTFTQLFFILAFCASSQLSAQNTDTHNTSTQKMYRLTNYVNSYLYKGERYKFKDMRNIFSENALALENYDQAISWGKYSKMFNIGTISSLGIGAIALALDPPGDMYCDLFCITSGELIGYTMLIIAAPMAIVALCLTATTTTYRDDSVKIFNQEPHTGDDTSLELKIGLGQNGLGLFVGF